MLAENEPISAGNLKAALGWYGRPLSAFVAYGTGTNGVTLRGGGSGDFTVASGKLECARDGIYEVAARVIAKPTGYQNTEKKSSIYVVASGSLSAKVPVAIMSADEGYPEQRISTADFRIELRAGDVLAVMNEGVNSEAEVALSVVRVG